MPVSIGNSMPPVSPNEWNTGSTLNTTSAGVTSKRAMTCATLARRLRWDSTTPLGAPSEPEVNSTTAGSSGVRRSSMRPASRTARSFSPVVIEARMSSR